MSLYLSDCLLEYFNVVMVHNLASVANDILIHILFVYFSTAV